VVLSGNRLRWTPTTANTIVICQPSRQLSKRAPPPPSRLSLLCEVGEAKAIKRCAKKSAESIDGSILEAVLIVTMHGREPYRSSTRCRSVAFTHMKINRRITNHYEYDEAEITERETWIS